MVSIALFRYISVVFTDLLKAPSTGDLRIVLTITRVHPQNSVQGQRRRDGGVLGSGHWICMIWRRSAGDMWEKPRVLGSSPLCHLPWATSRENHFTCLSRSGL